MKKALILSIAALLMAAPMAQAQTDHKKRQTHSQSELDYKKPQAKAQPLANHKKPQTHSQMKKSASQKVMAKKHWSKGQRMNDWKKHSAVSDYKRHGLRKPGNGQRWVKVDNQYVLIGIMSGLIAGIAAAQ